jgi:Amt family ammonium transporter
MAHYRWVVIPVSTWQSSSRCDMRDAKKHVSNLSVATENLNQWYSPGDQAYILIASAMVMVMIPGLGFLYSGLARRKSALSMIWACMASCSVITFQWYFWGYSLAFSNGATNGFIGNLQKFGLMETLGAPSPGSPLIPELLYAFYQVRAVVVLSCCLSNGRESNP